MNKKKIFVLALAVCLLATVSFSTLAWFNAADKVENKFYVADSDGDGTPDFTIDVFEEAVKSDDEDGNPDDNKPGKPGDNKPGDNKPGKPDDNKPDEDKYTDAGNTYKDILPGDILAKNVFVQNTGDYDQWVRVHVTFSDSAVWQQAIGKAADAEGMKFDEYVTEKLLGELQGYTSAVCSFNAYGEDTMTYTFYLTDILAPEAQVNLMKTVNIPSILVQEDMDFGKDGFTVTIRAQAVQVRNLKAQNAANAFAEVGWEIGNEYGE